ncbi:MAG: aminopeptidase [Anaerovoracaceae bacterium]|jgi:aspartyl aminopeptidase
MSEKEEKKTGWEACDDAEKESIMKFADGYIDFINTAKTEREAAREIVRIAGEHGFKDISGMEKLSPGDKVYYINHGKSVYLAVIGKQPVTEGFNGVGAHIDAPRLDLKQEPLFEDSGMAFFRTHYYGGIKKYQWTTIPLALHGVVSFSDGRTQEIRIGEEDGDPVFLVTDLLPHLASKQNAKKLADGVEGEKLSILAGSIPDPEAESDKVKAALLKILKEKYGMEEEDFTSAEIEAVPAEKARTLGLDGSMVAGYGQDDRICAYPGLMALMSVEGVPERTAVGIFSDKEEIGSVGNTGMASHNFELFMMDVLEKTGVVNPYAVQRTFSASRVLSADVTAAFDPAYPDVMEKQNAAFAGKGININKYTGARGKSGASDANAEFIGFVRGVFDAAGVEYQFSELGKVDAGGGGTIAYILADRGMNVLDCGVPILSMHSPYEAASKFDIYQGYKAYKAFLAAK